LDIDNWQYTSFLRIKKALKFTKSAADQALVGIEGGVLISIGSETTLNA